MTLRSIDTAPSDDGALRTGRAACKDSTLLTMCASAFALFGGLEQPIASGWKAQLITQKPICVRLDSFLHKINAVFAADLLGSHCGLLRGDRFVK